MKNIIKIKTHINRLVYIIYFVSFSISCFMNKEEMPDDFNFIATYGIAEENNINTFDSTFTKRINWDKDSTIALIFPINEKQKIFNLIRDFEIEKYPIDFQPKPNKDISPSPTYYFLFEMNGIIYEINWEINTSSNERRAMKLSDIFFHIDNYIKNENAYLCIPEDERIVF